MKKLLCILLLILLLFSFSSCEKTEPVTLSEYITESPMALTAVKLDHTAEMLCAYKNILFTLAEGKIYRTDVAASQSTAIIEDSTAIAIACDGYRLAVVGESDIAIYDYEGSELTRHPHGLEKNAVPFAAVGGEYVTFVYGDAYSGKRKHDIYSLNLESGELKLLPGEWGHSKAKTIVDDMVLTDDGRMLLDVHYFKDTVMSESMLVEYDLSKDKANHYYSTEKAITRGTFDRNGEFYLLDDLDGLLNDEGIQTQFIRKYNREDEVFDTVMIVDNKSLYEMGFKPTEFYESTIPGIVHMFENEYSNTVVLDSYRLSYADGDSFVIWNTTANTVAAFTRDTTQKPLVIALSSGWDQQNIERLTVEYTALTGKSVQLKNYPRDTYGNLMRTKLMAGDYDFDLFIADSALLDSLLTHTVYEPLNNYHGIVANYDTHIADGIKELMTDDGSIFGVPMRLSAQLAWNVQDESATIPENMSYDDLFSFCDSLEGTGKKAFVDYYLAFTPIVNLVEDMLRTDGEVNKDELATFLARFKEYSDKDVLYDKEGEYILTYGFSFLSYGNLFANYRANSEKFDQRQVAIPSPDGSRYIDIESSMVMNRTSQNKEAAAEFLEMMTSEKIVYNNRYDILMGKDITKYSEYPNLAEGQIKNIEFVTKQYATAKRAQVDLSEVLREDVMEPLLAGEISPEKAAEMISKEVKYLNE